MNESLIVIIFDSNFFLLPAQSKLDIYSEIDRLLPEPVQIIIYQVLFTELELKISKLPPNTKLAREYRLARELLHRHPHRLISTPTEVPGYVDDFLLQEAHRWQEEGHHVYLATIDRELRKKARAAQISTLFARNHNTLEIA